jgi:Mg2+-importing ATPase
VVSGTALAQVVTTGPATAFGDIAARLATRPPETEFECGTQHFALLILRTVLFLVLFVLVVSVALHRPAFESLLFAVALAVGLTPEFLPMIITVTLGQGCAPHLLDLGAVGGAACLQPHNTEPQQLWTLAS